MVEKNSKNKKEGIELENIPFVGGLFKGLEKLIDLAEEVEQAGGEIRKTGEIKGLGGKEGVKGIYGFSIRTGIGQKGRPHIQTFGNIRSAEEKTGKRQIKVAETREPIVDVFDEKDHILIVAELPGVSKEDIKLDLKGDILLLEASDGRGKFAKEVLLGSPVEMESKEISYKNGILELKLTKKTKNKAGPVRD